MDAGSNEPTDRLPNDAAETASIAPDPILTEAPVGSVDDTGQPSTSARQSSSTQRAIGQPSTTAGRRGTTVGWVPASILTIFLILLAVGGALEGYAVSLVVSADPIGRQYALAWAGLGAALVVTAWGLRGRRWWAAAAAIGVAIVGFVAGLFGLYGLTVLRNGIDCAATANGQCAGASEPWLIGVGLVAVGAASIATIGLLSTAWGWLTGAGTTRPR